MKKVFLIFVLLCMQLGAYAQCAMCKAAPTSNMNAGGSVATNLNVGILYLMAIPYVLLMGGVAYVFRKQLTEKWKQFRSK